MRIATWQWGGRRCTGTVSADGRELTPIDLGPAAQEKGGLALIELLAAGGALPAASSARLPVSAVALEAPIPRPRRNLFCVGRNYRAHAKELSASVFKGSSQDDDGWPIVFTKVPECVIATGQTVRLPHGVSSQIDYEAELAVVIGQGGRDIPASRAMAHVWGYTIVNDVTARDVQMRHKQWDLGKSFDTFCPMGPWMVSADEIDGTDLLLTCRVNGAVRQQARTSELIFDIPTLIETCSRGITLYPGDIIATGTPAGVGMGLQPPVFLQAGDVVSIEIEGIGTLENDFR